ncbi:MAG: hypothetical protein ACFE95_07690 [Candidatus Hodarchaeota archaeon]
MYWKKQYQKEEEAKKSGKSIIRETEHTITEITYYRMKTLDGGTEIVRQITTKRKPKEREPDTGNMKSLNDVLRGKRSQFSLKGPKNNNILI